jgi:hypothetical protein
MAGKMIKLPVIGEVKTGYVIAAGVALVGILGVAYYRNSKNTAAAAASGTTAADTATAATDPETGYPEGSPEDLAALEALNGGGTYGDQYATGYGQGSGTGELYYDPADGQYDLTSPYQATTTTTPTANTGPGTFTDYASWVSYAEQYVTGYTQAQIQGALAAAYAGVALSTTQLTIFQAATAVAGVNPSGIVPKTAPQAPGGTGTGTGTTTTPPAGTGTAYAVNPVTGIAVEGITKTGAKFQWSKSAGAKTYTFQIWDGATRVDYRPALAANTPSVSTSILKPGHSYTADVFANPGKPGAARGSVNFSTPKA